MRNVFGRKMAVGFGALALAVVAAPAYAGPQADAPGTPGDPNCRGQTTAFLAQLSKEALDAPGLGNYAKYFANMSVQDIHAMAKKHCEG